MHYANFIKTVVSVLIITTHLSAMAVNYTNCTKISGTAVDAGLSKSIPILNETGDPCPECGTMQVTKDDWGTKETYKCSKGTQADTCQPEEYAGCLALAATSLGIDPEDGTNLGYDTTFACENQATRACASQIIDVAKGTWEPTPGIPPVPFAQCQLLQGTTRNCLHLVDGTSFCDDYTEKYACYSDMGPALCNTDPNCSLTGLDCTEAAQAANGLCSTQKQTYSCVKSQTSCAEYGSSNPSACPINMDSNLPPTKVAKDNKFAESQAQIEQVGQMAKGIGTEDGVLKLFGGLKAHCDYPDSIVAGAVIVVAIGSVVVTGGASAAVIAGAAAAGGAAASGTLQPNCCKINLDQPKGSIFDKCFPEEFALQAAKLGKRAHQTDAYCSKKMSVTQVCLQHTEVWCAFPSLFSRIVQEQGRLQLDAYLLNKSDAGAQSSAVSYPFYAATEVGNWTPPIAVNGNAVTAWTWPSYCKDTARYRQLAQTQDYVLGTCPEEKPVTYMATCAKGLGACGDLPKAPYDPTTGEMAHTTPFASWIVAPVDASAPIHESISGSVAVKGFCNGDTNKCDLDVVAWPGGVGGVSKFAVPVAWPYLLPVELAVVDQKAVKEPEAAPGIVVDGGFNWIRQPDAVFDELVIRPYALDETTEGTKPAYTLMQYSLDSGASWNAVHVPLTVDSGAMFLQANTEKFGTLDIYGRCDATTRSCSYTVLAAAPVLAKPWGSRDPDCSGFTMTQMGVLDFGAMDFSEWIAAMGITAQGSVQNVLADAIQAQTGSVTFAQRVEDNESQNTSKRDITVASVSPGVCSKTNCILDIKATGVWPESIGGDPGNDAVVNVKLFSDVNELVTLEAVRDAEGKTVSYKGTYTLSTNGGDGSTVPLTIVITSADNTVHRVNANLPIQKNSANATRLDFIFTKYTSVPLGQTPGGVTYQQLKEDGAIPK